MVLGLPLNSVSYYFFLLVACVVIFSGSITLRSQRWLMAAACVAAGLIVPFLLAPSPIAQGENVFLPHRSGNIFEQKLPPDVYRFLKSEFDKTYPLSVRCAPEAAGCWQNQGEPDTLYAFSADGLLDNAGASRAVTEIDFSDAVRLRLGFVNDKRYNWLSSAPDVHRSDRNRQFWMGYKRWQVAMPWFAMFQIPADHAGSQLCWRGDVLWPAGSGYETVRHDSVACRSVAASDTGKPIFASAIKPGMLSMELQPPLSIKLRLLASTAIKLLAAISLLLLLVRVRLRETVRPFVLIAFALAVVFVNDASFIGGFLPMDGGDDGLFYTGVARQILQHVLDGDIATALMGGEKVYYYGGPGLRYFRAIEMVLFGDSNLGYLSLMLTLPILVWCLFRRFLSDVFAWRLALMFTALPLGEIVGTCFIDYAKWAARGFADPAAHAFIIWGAWVTLTRRATSGNAAIYGLGGSFLFALAVFMKPVVAPIAGIILAGVGLTALWHKEWSKVAALVIGFTPVLLMPLHNWYFGREFVLFSSNANLPILLVMPVSAWLSAVSELVHLNFAGEHLHRALVQIGGWLSGPGEQLAFVPFNAAVIVMVVMVVIRGRDLDPALRLIGAAVLAECAVDLLYAPTPRYFLSMWLLAMVVVAGLAERRLPDFLARRGWTRAGVAVAWFLGPPDIGRGQNAVPRP
jgi:hypothetical protein